MISEKEIQICKDIQSFRTCPHGWRNPKQDMHVTVHVTVHCKQHKTTTGEVKYFTLLAFFSYTVQDKRLLQAQRACSRTLLS